MLLTFAALMFSVLVCTAVGMSQESGSAGMPGMRGMDHSQMKKPAAVEDPRFIAKQLADKRESEINHRLAGLFVIGAGTLVFWGGKLDNRWPVLRYGWGVCFLVAGLFLLVFSDTEIWPFGPQSVWYALAHDPEDLQHKIFAVILVGIGIAQIQTVRGKLRKDLLGYFFPVAALAGSILLVFHTHSGDMSAPNAMETMEHIQAQHTRFAATGLAIAITSIFAVRPQRYQQFCRKTWPLLLVLLGGLLMFYTE